MTMYLSAEKHQFCGRTKPFRLVKTYLEFTTQWTMAQVVSLLLAFRSKHEDAECRFRDARAGGQIVCDGEPSRKAMIRMLGIHSLQKIAGGDVEAASFALGQRFNALFPASPTVSVTLVAQEASKVENNQPAGVKNSAAAVNANLVMALTEQEEFAALIKSLRIRACNSGIVLGQQSNVAGPSELTLWLEHLLQSSWTHAFSLNGGSKALYMAEGRTPLLLYEAIRQRAEQMLADHKFALAAEACRMKRWLSLLRRQRYPITLQHDRQRRIMWVRALAQLKYGTTPTQGTREALVRRFRDVLEERDQRIENDPLFAYGGIVLKTGIECLNEISNSPIEVTQFMSVLTAACPTGRWSQLDLLFAVTVALATRSLRTHYCKEVRRNVGKREFRLTLLRSVLDTRTTTLGRIGKLYLHADRQVKRFFEELSASARA